MLGRIRSSFCFRTVTFRRSRTWNKDSDMPKVPIMMAIEVIPDIRFTFPKVKRLTAVIVSMPTQPKNIPSTPQSFRPIRWPRFYW